jgi:adenylosuccinate lyase
MRRNLEQTKGLIFSGQLLLELTSAGMSREDAYRLVQGHAMESWRDERDFRAAIEGDQQISDYLDREKLDAIFSIEPHLKNVDGIFNRVFGEQP